MPRWTCCPAVLSGSACTLTQGAEVGAVTLSLVKTCSLVPEGRDLGSCYGDKIHVVVHVNCECLAWQWLTAEKQVEYYITTCNRQASHHSAASASAPLWLARKTYPQIFGEFSASPPQTSHACLILPRPPSLTVCNV